MNFAQNATVEVMNLSDKNYTNDTDSNPMPRWRANLLVSYKILLTALLVFIMVAMGCTLSLATVWKHMKRPVGVVIGLCGQFFVLPLCAFGFAHALSLEPEAAIGTIVLSTCPGGTVSNIVTYWNDGDVSLR